MTFSHLKGYQHSLNITKHPVFKFPIVSDYHFGQFLFESKSK